MWKPGFWVPVQRFWGIRAGSSDANWVESWTSQAIRCTRTIVKGTFWNSKSEVGLKFYISNKLLSEADAVEAVVYLFAQGSILWSLVPMPGFPLPVADQAVHSASLACQTSHTKVSRCVSSGYGHLLYLSPPLGDSLGTLPCRISRCWATLPCWFSKYLFSLIISGYHLNKTVKVLMSSLHSKTINKCIK